MSAKTLVKATTRARESTPAVRAPATVKNVPIGPVDDAFERESDELSRRALNTAARPQQASPNQPPAPPRVAPAAGASGGPGKPLPPAERDFFERGFGHDFSRVRIHSDAESARFAHELNAFAYTVDSDIYFGEGRYAPGTTQGRLLLAHELAHTLQQDSRSSRRSTGLTVSRAPLSVQRQPRDDTASSETDVQTPGALAFLSLSTRYPTLQEVEQYLVDSDLISQDEVADLNALPIGDARNPAGWTLTDANGREVVEVKYHIDKVNGQKYFVADLYVSLADGSGGTHPGQQQGTGKSGDQKPKPGDGKSEGDKEFDAELKANPHWQNLSQRDRKLLQEYAKLSPDDLAKQAEDAPAPNMSDVKLSIALKLSSGWPGEILEAAKTAFTDPKFVIMLVVTLAIYVGLWLVPDPSFITKAAAGILTAVLLLQFAWEDIYGLAKAWLDLQDECEAATTVGELKTAGDKFSKKVGAVGFDILMFIATFALGKAVGPKLAKVGAARGVKAAEARVQGAESNVAKAEAEPGSGVVGKATPEVGKLLDQAKTNAKGTTATAVLDAFNDLLPEPAQRGLRGLRDGNLGAEGVLRMLEGMGRSGKDIVKFLADKGVPEGAAKSAKAEVDAARDALTRSQIGLARARLIESRTIADPALRQSVREQQYASIRAALQAMGELDGSELSAALRGGDMPKILAELRRIIDKAVQPRVPEAQGATGEAILREGLQSKYAGRKGIRILNNVAVLRRLKGVRSIAEWRAAEQTRLKAESPELTDADLQKRLSRGAARFFEDSAKGEVYEGRDIDAMAVDTNVPGKPRPIEVAEVKTGSRDSAANAQAQLGDSMTMLNELAKGGAKSDIKIYQLADKKTLGADLTDTLDLSRLQAAEQTTLGPKGSDFPQQLDLTSTELRGVADSLVKNLPPSGPQTIPPTALPRGDDNGQPQKAP